MAFGSEEDRSNSLKCREVQCTVREQTGESKDERGSDFALMCAPQPRYDCYHLIQIEHKKEMWSASIMERKLQNEMEGRGRG